MSDENGKERDSPAEGNKKAEIRKLKTMNKTGKVIHKMQKCPTNDEPINSIDLWPSFASTRNVSENSIILEKSRLNVLSEADSKLLKNTPKPKLLSYLESYLSEQMKKHNIKEGEVNPVRLQVYREVFDWLIESFKTYRPLLVKIKQEYEINLSYLKEEIGKLEPMKEMLWTIAEYRDQQILKIKMTENKKITELNQEISNLLVKLSEYEANNTTLQFEIDHLSKKLESEHESYRKESDSKKLLIMDINEMKAQLEDIARIKKEKDEVEEEDPVILRFAIEEAIKSHAKAVKELSDMKAVYANSVSLYKYELLEKKHNLLSSQFKVVSEKLLANESQLKLLEDKYSALNQQRDFYYFKYMDLAKSTPTGAVTMWDKFADIGGTDRWQDLAGKGKTVSEIAQTILTDLNTETVKEPIEEESETESSSVVNEETKKQETQAKEDMERVAENKNVLRTMVEMMCELPPGTISPGFDPLELLPLLTKEKHRRENVGKEVKESKPKSKKSDREK